MRATAIFVVLVISSSPAFAEPPSILWPEKNPRFHWAEYAFSTAALLFNIFNDKLVPGVERELWHGGILFDDGIDRWATNIPRGTNDAFAHFGDFTLYGLVIFPFLIDAVTVAWLVDGSPDVAWQISMISGEVLLTSSLLNVIAKRYLTRNRPATPRCEEGAEECPRGSSIHSFYSGHAAQMFAGAGVTCANHLNLRLFQNRAADVSTCVAAIGFATAGAVSRVTNRSHYTSDVVIGSTLGFAIGYLIPVLLHYRNGVLSPMAGEALGLSYSATF